MSLTLSQSSSDNFQRPDVDPLAAPWVADQHGDRKLKIVSDLCYSELTGGGVMLYEPVSPPADQYVAVTIGPSGLSSNFAELVFCARTTDNGQQPFGGMPGYLLTFGDSFGSLYWQLALLASGTALASGVPSALNPGDVWILAVVGTTLYAIQNNVILAKVTDATLSGGSALLQIDNGSQPSNVSNFAIGAASGTANVGDTVVFGVVFGGAPSDVYDPQHRVTLPQTRPVNAARPSIPQPFRRLERR